MPDTILAIVDAFSRPRSGGDIADRRIVEGLREIGVKVAVREQADLPPWLHDMENGSMKSASTALWYASQTRGYLRHALVLEDDVLFRQLVTFNRYLRRFRPNHIAIIAHHLEYPFDRSPHDAYGRERAFLTTGDRIFVPSWSTMVELLQMGIPRNRITRFLPGIDPTYHADSPRDRHGCDGCRLDLLFVGRVEERKGVIYLLEALDHLNEPEYRLHIAGEAQGTYAERVKAFISARNLSERVIFYGHLTPPKLRALYRRCDLLILPSLWEGFGLVIVEAMAQGLPVIASNTGAIPEIVVDGLNGILVPPAQPAILTRALVRVAENRELLDELTRGARRTAENWPNWPASISTIGQSLKELALAA